jgi:uncharacterized membrane protein YkvA (DUF1232 family)
VASDSSWRRRGAQAALILSVLYLIYPSLGIFELIPDYIPFVGNVDEGLAGALIFWAIRTLREKQEPPMKQARSAEDPRIDGLS